MRLFDSQSKSLYDFFNEPFGFYIPFYQRQYSWDTENVKKLMDDIYDGVRTVCDKPDYLRFIGAVILFQEMNPHLNVHHDYPGLLANIHNVIDGQQRISTIAVIACLLHSELKSICEKLKSNVCSSLSTVPKLISSITNAQYELEEFYSIQIRKADVNPNRKPIIIRAVNQRENPATDQWTLRGNYADYYKSEIASLIATYIAEGHIPTDVQSAKLKANIEEICTWIERTMSADDFPSAEQLLSDKYLALRDFTDRNINLQEIKDANRRCYEIASGCIKLLAFIKFLTHRTYVTYISCPSEDPLCL
jgi:hypothetical protein